MMEKTTLFLRGAKCQNGIINKFHKSWAICHGSFLREKEKRRPDESGRPCFGFLKFESQEAFMKTCKEVMTSNPVCCLPDQPVHDVAQLMKSEGVGSIPVIENRESHQLIGILTDRDLALKVIAAGWDPAKAKVRDVMKHNPFTCLQSDDVQMAVDLMASHQVRRIPVVEQNNRIVGIIAQGDIATRLDEAEKTGELVAKISK
jgi:CBS domain-containing protein